VSSRPNAPDRLDEKTRQAAPLAAGGVIERVPALTLLGHAQAARTGERATLLGLRAGEAVSLSRTEPSFSALSAGASPRPLADPFLSRHTAASLAMRDGALELHRDLPDVTLRVDGVELGAARSFNDDELERGVVIELADRVVLLLHTVDAIRGRRQPSFDLVGESDAMQRLRKDLARAAATELRVLVRGATGTGKELVARAIHKASARASGPYEAVNMGAIQASLSASALFGHVRGAFSGAVADQDGHFVAADKGTLFLDEIGDTDPAVQASMLRTLETREVVRVGDRRPRKVDVRLISATDADLEAEVAAGRFREPLLHRIGELTLRVPALAERRDDIGRLVVHFMREMLDAEEQARLLDGEIQDTPWLSASVLATLARAPWTGNVRQLRNVVRQLVVLGREEPTLTLGADLLASLGPSPGPKAEREGSGAPDPEVGASAAAPSDPKRVKRPQDLTEEDLVAALEQTGWRRGAAADLLGIARSSLYALIAAKGIVRANDLEAAQIESSLAKHRGDLAAAARELKVSEHGLKLRMQALGL
jgi:two-component system nitrogen regulation response regulator GlnG